MKSFHCFPELLLVKRSEPENGAADWCFLRDARKNTEPLFFFFCCWAILGARQHHQKMPIPVSKINSSSDFAQWASVSRMNDGFLPRRAGFVKHRACSRRVIGAEPPTEIGSDRSPGPPATGRVRTTGKTGMGEFRISFKTRRSRGMPCLSRSRSPRHRRDIKFRRSKGQVDGEGFDQIIAECSVI